jgi:prevent-host-death family protein
MRDLSIREMRAELSRLEDLVGEEGEIFITRHGRPIARVLPMLPTRRRPTHRELRDALPRLRDSSADLIRQDRDGRG